MRTKPKPARLEIRTTSTTYREWQKAAKRDGRSLSGWVRFVLNRAAKE
jgi:uncharacterized protein (DUF1778 family)